jgi:hypothetical protein
MKQKFKNFRFRSDSRDLLDQCNRIIEDYQAQGLTLTLRQMYYQLVSANIVSNTERSYKKIGNLLSKGRLAGLVDWNAIEDRVRQADTPSEWSSLNSLVDSAMRSFRLPRLRGQRLYVELWCEKDALAGVLSPLASRYHVTLMVNRGYSSQSAMYESAGRIENSLALYGSTGAVILYLGDLDPSGEDMVRDIDERLRLFLPLQIVTVKKIALNLEQVTEYNLPPNPAKLSDTRAAAFIKQYGRQSWEVDALAPPVLQELVEDELKGILDLELVEEIKNREERDKQKLADALELDEI